MHARNRTWLLGSDPVERCRQRTLPVEGGDGSTLSLDFTTGVLDPRLTFTRSTTGTFTNASGLVASAAINTPRFDYDPSTLQPRGLLIEGSASNLWTYSQDQSQWAVSNVTVNTGTQATAPDGTTSLFPVLTNTTSSVQYFVRQRSADSITATTGQVYTYSMFVKKGTHRYVQMFASATTIFTNAAQANFDLDDGTTGNVTNCTPTAVAYGNGWWRLSIAVTANASATQSQPFLLYLVSSKTATRAENLSLSSQSIYVWGAQVELGSGASSYIPTGASQGTRNVDNCELLNLTTMGFNASAGTIYVDTGTRIGTGGRSYSFMPTSGINDQIFEGGGFLLNVYSSGTFVAQIGTGTASAAKIAAAYAVNDYAVSVNGGAPSTDTAGALPTTIAKLTIGARDSSSVTQMNGCIRVFKYWPTRLPNAQLQSITT
jgi:hypothetical protein